MPRKERVIFQSISFMPEESKNEIIKEFKESNPELNFDDYQIINDYLEMDISDTLENLDVELYNKILVIANLGLWNGRKSGFKIIGSNLKEILNSGDCDEVKIYSDGYNIKFTGHHHDGTNEYTFRLIKDLDNVHNLINQIYNGTATSSMITRYTKSLLPKIKKIYGW